MNKTLATLLALLLMSAASPTLAQHALEVSDCNGLPASIVVISPNGGENWVAGTSHNVVWTISGNVDTVRLEYSTNNGGAWSDIIGHVPATPGSYSWTVPNTPTSLALVRVTWIDSAYVTDRSDTVFIISTATTGPWVQVGSGMGQIWTLAMNPVNQDIMYTGSYTLGMYRTTNGGTNWSPINTGLLNLTIQTSAISASNPNVIYCGTSPTGTNVGVYKSTDVGATWTLINNGITDTPLGVQALAIDPTNADIVYVAIFDGTNNAVTGLYKTTNGGTNWFASNTGIGAAKNILSIAINPLNPNTLYVGTSFLTPSGSTTEQARIYKSTNAGASWVDVSVGLPPTQGLTTHDPVRTLSIQAADTNRALAGLFMNEAQGGMFLTTNGGTSWTRIHTGLPTTIGTLPRSVLIKPGSTTEFFVGLGRSTNDNVGVFRTTNAGQSWVDFNGGTMMNTYTIRALLYSTSAWKLYAGAAHPTVTAGQGVFSYQFVPVRVAEQPQIPTEFALYQNYPNPFNPSTRIGFMIQDAGFTSLKVYDVLGREVATLVDAELKPGSYEVILDGSSLASGAYFYRLRTGSFVETKKLMLVR